MNLLNKKYPNLSIYLWGTSNEDSISFYISHEGMLSIHQYFDDKIVDIHPILSKRNNTLRTLKSAWNSIPIQYKYDTFLNFISGNQI